MGWDLADLYTQRRLRFILNAIEHLPRTSHFVTAFANDEDVALATPTVDDSKPKAPPLTEWSSVVDMLARVYDRLGELIAVTASANSKKTVKPPRPLPRPVTASDRIKARSRMATHQRIVDMVKPQPGKPTMADAPVTDTQHVLQRDR